VVVVVVADTGGPAGFRVGGGYGYHCSYPSAGERYRSRLFSSVVHDVHAMTTQNKTGFTARCNQNEP